MSNHTEQEVLARLGAHVTAFALRHGWKSDGPEGAFEYIQRISYTQGMDDARPYWVRTYRDLEDHDASIQQAIEKTEERVRFVLQGGLLDGRPNQAQEKEAARQWDEWAGEMNRCRDATLEQVARICDEEGREWDSDALVTTKNYAAHCATRIRALKKTPHQDHYGARDFKTAWAEFERAGYRYGQDALEQVEFGFKIAQGLRPAYNPHVEPHCAALASAPVPVLKDWRIDTSAGGPILVYKDCSVIESAQAEYVLRLIAADQASAPVAGEARQLPTINVGGKERPQQWFTAKEVRQLLDAAPQTGGAVRPALTVWYGSMPESNGKSNWTAILHRKGDGLMDGPHITIDRSEYPDRVRYEADRVRYIIGEIDKEPSVLDYDDKLVSPPFANHGDSNAQS